MNLPTGAIWAPAMSLRKSFRTPNNAFCQGGQALMIRVQNLVKTFGSFTAVNDVSFDVAAGEIFAFLGPNGAGKTTTIKMLTTLLHPTSGNITLDGIDPQTHQNAVRQSFGIVFQDPSLD